MEYLESNDPKSELLKKSEQYKAGLQGDAKHVADRTQKIITNALIIGGSLALAYWLVRRSGAEETPTVTTKPKKVKVVHHTPAEEVQTEVVHEHRAPGLLSEISTAIASQATAFLLSIAREKLMEFLHTQMEKKINSNEQNS